MIELHTAGVLDWAPGQPADRFDLVFGSPPYMDARTYGIDAQRDCEEWVEWMLRVSIACARICRGPVFWVVAGVTRKRNYWPGPEGLMWEWWKRGGQLYRPCAFHRVGIPGSGGDDYLRADWEYIVCLKRPGKLAWSDNKAAGHAPKHRPGGAFSHRKKDGRRVGEKQMTRRKADGRRTKTFHAGKKYTKQNADGELLEQNYVPPDIANPGNVFSGKVGKGHMGNDLAHENEAPFPEWLVEPFVVSFCPPGGTVLDPFCGSGTTLAVAQRCGRNAVGVDLRPSQIEICKKRLAQKPLFEQV